MQDEPLSDAREQQGLGGRLLRAARRWRVALGALAVVPLVAVGAPDTLRIPIKDPPHPASEPQDAAVFSHWEHNDFQCYACHPSIFPQRKLGFTHADMNEGRFCGACHNGVIAFHPNGEGVDCETCHVPSKSEEIDEDDIFGSFGR